MSEMSENPCTFSVVEAGALGLELRREEGSRAKRLECGRGACVRPVAHRPSKQTQARDVLRGRRTTTPSAIHVEDESCDSVVRHEAPCLLT